MQKLILAICNLSNYGNKLVSVFFIRYCTKSTNSSKTMNFLVEAEIYESTSTLNLLIFGLKSQRNLSSKLQRHVTIFLDVIEG